MLCLSRKSQESILIGDNITIQIIRISGDKVRIGITAPRDMNIVRTELLERSGDLNPQETEPHGP